MKRKELYVATEGFPVLCCVFPIQQGDVLSIHKQASKNRLFITREGSIHKVKASTFRRCTTPCHIPEA